MALATCYPCNDKLLLNTRSHPDVLRRYVLFKSYSKGFSRAEDLRTPTLCIMDKTSKTYSRIPITITPIPRLHYDIQPPTLSYYIDTLETIGGHRMIRLENFTVKNIQDAHATYLSAVRLVLSNCKDGKIDPAMADVAARSLFILYRMYVHFIICSPSESWLETSAYNMDLEPTRLEMWRLDRSPWLKRVVQARKLKIMFLLPNPLKERERAPMWWRMLMTALVNALFDDQESYDIFA